ncbi:MAG: hypothetical protein A2885_13290 [Sphingopyxis sp. RIFCSPHIGHO2_01_FULL_65_24]|nr:MAG: hypothetical protein A2885_13290 [Sphingopyxis sp. RIFCSPHIGHO2_01_FULL_65_24]
MKRDMDLVRELLLAIEDDPSRRLARLPDLQGRTKAVVLEHVQLCVDAGLIEAQFFKAMNPRDAMAHDIRLTWTGHEFLDATRSPEIWTKTKAGAAKVGSTSMKLLFEIASGYAKAELARLGVPML